MEVEQDEARLSGVRIGSFAAEVVDDLFAVFERTTSFATAIFEFDHVEGASSGLSSTMTIVDERTSNPMGEPQVGRRTTDSQYSCIVSMACRNSSKSVGLVMKLLAWFS